MKTVLKITGMAMALTLASLAAAQDTTVTSNSTSNGTGTGMGTGYGYGGNGGAGNASVGVSSSNTAIFNFPAQPTETTSNNNVKYDGTYTVKTPPTVYSPALTTTLNDTCMGSSSFGGSLPGFGFSGGTTWTDTNCVRRLDAREFRAMNMNDVAMALLCQNQDNARAVQATGRSCPGIAKAGATSTEATNITQSGGASTGSLNGANEVQYSDPIVRARIGLPPLAAGSAKEAQ